MAHPGKVCRNLLLLIGPWALVACGGTGTPPRSAAGKPAGERLAVVTTFVPITLFTRAVAGECASVSSLVPAQVGPHAFQARPADLAALRQARVLVKNGVGMEGFLARLVASAGSPRLTTIDSSRGITTLASAHPGDGQGPSHDSDHGHAHGPMNAHIWLDPLRAAQQVATIRDGLAQADPRCADGYRRNAAAFIAQLQNLNREISSQLRPYRGKTFVAFHDVAPYFAERYGLKAAFLLDVPEGNPSPADLRRVAAQVQGSGLRALLSEPQEDTRSFQALAQDLGVRVSVFDPLETASEEAARDPATYGRVMRRNAAALRQAFGG